MPKSQQYSKLYRSHQVTRHVYNTAGTADVHCRLKVVSEQYSPFRGILLTMVSADVHLIEPADQTSRDAPASAAIADVLCMALCLWMRLFDCAIVLSRLDRLLCIDLASRSPQNDDLNVIERRY